MKDPFLLLKLLHIDVETGPDDRQFSFLILPLRSMPLITSAAVEDALKPDPIGFCNLP